MIGLIVQGFMGRDIDTTDIGTALVAIPGAALGLAVCYGFGLRAESGWNQAERPAQDSAGLLV